MKKLIDLLKTAYKNRDKNLIREISEFFDENCIVMGTSFGELERGKTALRELLEGDFSYWVDLNISSDYDVKKVGDFEAYEINANGLYTFRVDETCYKRYVGYMQAICKEDKTQYAKAIKAIWELDHLLASKPKVFHRYEKSVLLRLIVKDNLVKLISFNMPMDKNHIDCFWGENAESDAEFAEEMKYINADEKTTEEFKQSFKIDGLSFDEIKVEREKNLFFGSGYLTNDTTISEEIAKDFEILNGEQSAYSKLYNLRKKLGETLRLYSMGETQRIMVRFFGIMLDGKISYQAHAYPFYWVLDD